MNAATLKERILDALDTRVRRAKAAKKAILESGKGDHHPIARAANEIIAEYAAFEKIINQISENGG